MRSPLALVLAAAVLGGCRSSTDAVERNLGPLPNADTSNLSGPEWEVGDGVPGAIGYFRDTRPAAMTHRLQEDYVAGEGGGGYRSWRRTNVHYLTSLNVFGVTYADPDFAAGLSAVQRDDVADQSAAFPLGASSVLELYNDAKGASLAGWAVLAKGTDEPGAKAWYSFLVTLNADGSMGVPAAKTMGDPACQGCHVPAPGYVLPVPPLSR